MIYPDHSLVAAFIIHGEPASKSNQRRWIPSQRRFIKSEKALDYLKAFEAQCPVLDRMAEGDLTVIIKIHYASRRPDLDESLILDAMQNKIYGNDRQVKIKFILWGLDRDNPRAEIAVFKI